MESNVQKHLDRFYRYGLFLVFAVLVLIFSIITNKFFTFANITNILLQSSSTGIATIGVVFVLLIGCLDLSIGTTIFLSATISGYLIGIGSSLSIVVLASLFCGAVIGSINGFFVAKIKVTSFIATLATMTFGRGFTLLFSGAKAQYLTGEIPRIMTRTRLLGIPLIVIIFIIILLIGQYILSNFRFGKNLYAVGNNESVARLVGINVISTKFFAFLLCGILAGLSGFLTSVQVGAVMPSLGNGQEFLVITCAVLGGTSLFGGKGNIIPGALIGILIFMVIENGLVLISANPYAYTVVRGIVIFIAVAVDCIRNKGELR